MKKTTFQFDAYVVAATFIEDVPALALGDGTVRLLKDDEMVHVVEAHEGGLLAASLTRDGKALITGGDDGRVMRIEADGSAQLLSEHKNKWIDAIATGNQDAVAFAYGREAVVRLNDGTEKHFSHERAVGGLAFAPKGQRLATATYNEARLYWVNADAKPQILKWDGAHRSVTFSPDGKFIVTTMQENALHGWRLSDGAHMRMTGYPAKVQSLSWVPKSGFLASSGARSAVLWPFQDKRGPMGKQPERLGAMNALVTCVSGHPDDDVCAIGYEDGRVLVVRIQDNAEYEMRAPDGEAITALGWSSEGSRFLAGTRDGAVLFVDLRDL